MNRRTNPCSLARIIALVFYFNAGQLLQLLVLVATADASFFVSTGLASSICKQRRQYFQTRVTQSPAVYRPLRTNVKCGWFVMETEGGGSVTYKTCGEAQPPYSAYYPYNQSPRIVGGVEAEPHEFPSTAFIDERPVPRGSRRGLLGRCSCTIIDPLWVLTAAHCLPSTGAGLYFVSAGRHNRNVEEATEQKRYAVKRIIHPQYRFDYWYEFDIALLKVKEPFVYNDVVQPARLPEDGYRATGNFTAVGWGALCDPDVNDTCRSSAVLRKVDLPYVPDDLCQERLGPPNYNHTVPEAVICAGTEEGGKEACNGDSGGPLYKIENGEQMAVGIASWSASCGNPKTPGVWTEVAYYIPWIREMMAANT